MTRKLVNLKDNNDILVPQVFPSIDENNIVFNNASSGGARFNFTAPEDCAGVLFSANGNNTTISFYINGLLYYTVAVSHYIYISLKKGDILTSTSAYGTERGTLFGLKY